MIDSTRVIINSPDAVAETIILLMKSTGSYVAHRIHDKKFKDIYIAAMKKCISLVEQYDDFESYRFEISQREHYEAHEYRPTFWNKKKQERYYALMAVYQALEIVDKLYARFITGMEDTEPRAYKGKGILLPSNEGIFE